MKRSGRLIGIYKIENIVTKKFYIGSSHNIFRRWTEHISLLERNTHNNYLLQDAFNEYGVENFVFTVMVKMPDNTTKEKLLRTEQTYLSSLKPYLNDIGYNLSDTAYKEISNMYSVVTDEEMLNIVLSDEIKIKLKQNINTITNRKDKLINKYDDKYILSSSNIAKNSDILTSLRKDMENYFRNRLNCSSSDTCYWTCNHNYADQVKGHRYKKSWTPYNVREVKEKRNNLAFMMNVFANDFVIRNMECERFDKDKYALCVIVGWICSVADITKPINIYIPSKRMRELLINWLDV